MNIASQYRRNSVGGKSNTGLVVLLYDAVIASMFSGLRAMKENDIERRTKDFDHAMRILGHLQSTLDHELGGEVAKSLDGFYAMVTTEIVRASALSDCERIEKLINHTASIAEAWREVEHKEAAKIGQ